MNEPFVDGLRASLEAWEHEAALYWESIVRSPDVLRRFGQQINRTLESQQHIRDTLHTAYVETVTAQEQAARELYLLERLEHQIEALAARIDHLESTLNDG
jgi:hypothetical protein